MIAIVDYGMGNLHSVEKALERVGADVRIARTPGELEQADKIVLPGVGAFADAIAKLHDLDLVDPLVDWARRDKPFLGICLGLQLMFDVSYEDGQHTGLGIMPGKVVKFDLATAPGEQKLHVPHMGWNEISWDKPCAILAGIPNNTSFYFAHSYYVVPSKAEDVCTTTDYGCDFVSSVCRGNVFGTQFHPERSQTAGLKLLENFVRL